MANKEPKLIGIDYHDNDFCMTFMAIGDTILESIKANEVNDRGIPNKQLIKDSVNAMIRGMFLLHQSRNRNKYIKNNESIKEANNIEQYFQKNNTIDIYIGNEVIKYMDNAFMNGEFVLINYDKYLKDENQMVTIH